MILSRILARDVRLSAGNGLLIWMLWNRQRTVGPFIFNVSSRIEILFSSVITNQFVESHCHQIAQDYDSDEDLKQIQLESEKIRQQQLLIEQEVKYMHHRRL
jgi:hypothetical protein